MTGVDLRCGDCLQILPTLSDASVDAVICDPPYPEIQRPYGRMTEAEWHAMMRVVVPECRRVLKPTGSAVFVLQPNSRKVGSMRPWLWQFMAWCCHEWNMVQDAWWWNPAILPNGGACNGGLMRASVKAVVWLGDAECYRCQEAVLWEPNWSRIAAHAENRSQGSMNRATGNSVDYQKLAAATTRRGGSTPFNLIPLTNSNSVSGGMSYGHGAATPLALCDWWTRYISPEGGTILDPFMGSGTTGLAALARGRKFVGIERDEGYFKIASDRLSVAQSATPLFPVGAAP